MKQAKRHHPETKYSFYIKWVQQAVWVRKRLDQLKARHTKYYLFVLNGIRGGIVGAMVWLLASSPDVIRFLVDRFDSKVLGLSMIVLGVIVIPGFFFFRSVYRLSRLQRGYNSKHNPAGVDVVPIANMNGGSEEVHDIQDVDFGHGHDSGWGSLG